MSKQDLETATNQKGIYKKIKSNKQVQKQDEEVQIDPLGPWKRQAGTKVNSSSGNNRVIFCQ